MKSLKPMGRSLLVAAGCLLASPPLLAEDACPNRGELDTPYCDRDGSLVASLPSDPAQLKDPETLVFSFMPAENPAVYQSIFEPLVDRLASCTKKRVVYLPAPSSAAQIEAMRAGRLHIARFSTGSLGFAVNLAGAVPVVTIGNEKDISGQQVWAIVKADSPYKALADLKGKRVAHVSPSSNSGNLAPRVLFPDLGLVPDTDYKPQMSGGHDKSIWGVVFGDYDMAPVDSNVLERMIARKDVKSDSLRVIYKSPAFPTSAVAIAHDLKPELQATLRTCLEEFRFPDSMKKEYPGYDRFVPMTYKETWKPLREIVEKSGKRYDRATLEAEH